VTSSFSSLPPILSIVGHGAIAILQVDGRENGHRRLRHHGARNVDGECVMRQYLRRDLGRCTLLLPSRMLACSDELPLVRGTGEPHRIASPDGAAAGAGNLAVITGGADANFEIAARAAEKT
jgi:hypothetical protein